MEGTCDESAVAGRQMADGNISSFRKKEKRPIVLCDYTNIEHKAPFPYDFIIYAWNSQWADCEI